MNEKGKVYKNAVLNKLNELADYTLQRKEWPSSESFLCFVEAANGLFDDAAVSYLLEHNEIIYDKKVTAALRELDKALDGIDEYRTEEEIIQDPKMEIVRQKAANVLALIAQSDGSESTVEIVE